VVLPAIVALAVGAWQLPTWLSANIIVLVTWLCGAWLGFAWSKPRVGSLVIRSYLISLLIVGGYALGTHPDAPGTKAEYQQIFVDMVRGVGLIWFGGTIFGAALGEWMITLFISERRRAAFEQRWAYRFWTEFLRHPWKKIAYWARLGVDREDKEKATVFDLYMVRIFFTEKGIIRLLRIVLATIAIVFLGVKLSELIKPLL
jgi:hypothetical protein